MLPVKDVNNLIQQAVVQQVRLKHWLKTNDFCLASSSNFQVKKQKVQTMDNGLKV